LPGPSDAQLGATMDHIETVLAERAAQLGVEIHRGVAIHRIDANDERVLVNGTHEGRWLVGCDGGRSTVRKIGGFEFEGTEPELTGYSVLVDLADPAQLPLGRHNTPNGNYMQWQPGALRLAEFDGGAAHRSQLDIVSVQALVRRITGVDVTITALHLASTWTDRSMQATTYRRGRVLLAGDAAHIHSPLGGQGLNLGLGDAMNLGWKLAATLRRDAPDGLLDTYTAERHPIGARILEWTRAQVALMRPSSRALAAIMRDLIATRDGATYFAERVWSVNLRYGTDAHPLVGRSCPDFEFADGTRLGEYLRDGSGALVDFDAKLAPLEGTKHVALDAKDRLGLTALLVRPDGFVAWASDTTPDRDDLARAAARWFGG
jgi:2-polyprenyl-6-methoxyphenol hydroxylase-like FAD-dependent oxidoreductase